MNKGIFRRNFNNSTKDVFSYVADSEWEKERKNCSLVTIKDTLVSREKKTKSKV